MDIVDPVSFEQFSDDEESELPPVRLRDGINLRELIDTSVATFEVNLDQDRAEEEETKIYFDKEALLNCMDADCINFGSDDDDHSQTPFEKMALKMTNLTKDGKVKKREIRPGSGPIVPENAYVMVHYNAHIEFGDEPFDSTRLRAQPVSFRLGRGWVILGLDVAVASMKKGELSKFLIHPDMGYGKFGCPPRIPGNVEVLFEVELVNYLDNAAADAFEALSLEDKKKADFPMILKAAQAEHLTGNGLFKKKEYHHAINKYKKALNMLEKCQLKDEEEEAKQQSMLLKLYINLAVCYNKQKACRLACVMCRNALDIKPNNAKALYHYGKALIMLSEYDQARRRLLAAQKLEPTNPEIVEELKKLDKKKKAYQDNAKNFSLRMFNNKATEKSEATKKSSVSEEFEQAADKFLTDLIEDSDKNQLPLPTGLTAHEELCVRQKAENLGLIVRSQERRGERLTYICKPEPQ